MIQESTRMADRVAVHPITAKPRNFGPVLVGNDPDIHLGDGTGSTNCGRKWN